MRNNFVAKELEDIVCIQNIVRLKIVFASFLMFDTFTNQLNRFQRASRYKAPISF